MSLKCTKRFRTQTLLFLGQKENRKAEHFYISICEVLQLINKSQQQNKEAKLNIATYLYAFVLCFTNSHCKPKSKRESKTGHCDTLEQRRKLLNLQDR